MESDGESAGYSDQDEVHVRPADAGHFPSIWPAGDALRARGQHPPTAERPHTLPLGRADPPQSGDGQSLEDAPSPREAPFPMFKKRILRQLQEEGSALDRGWAFWRPRQRDALRVLYAEVCSGLSHLVIWKRSLHQIEGHFGTGIRSYFSFLRYLVILNVCSSVLVAGFILIPAIAFERLRDQDQLPPTDPLPLTGNCTAYSPQRLGLVNFYEYALDVLSGTGLLEMSYLFYGFYQPQNVHVQQGLTYNFSLAYLLTNIAIFLLAYSWIVHRAVMGFKSSVLDGDSVLTTYSNKVFAAWDFCVTQSEAARLKHNSIRYELKMDLQEEFLRQSIAARTGKQRAIIYLTRFLLNLLVLAIIGAAFFAIYRATAFSQANSTATGVTGLLIQYLPSIVITAANLITPLVFNQLVVWEKYSPATEIQLSLLRSVFLKFASLGVLLYTLWSEITCNGHSATASNCQLCGYNYIVYQCWETKVGQEMYKLMIFDFLIVIAVMILIDFPRKMMVQHCGWRVTELWGMQEFSVPQHVLEMVYGQTLCWIGSFYSPLLTLLNALKYFLVFYLKQLTLFTNCRPSNQTFRASSSTFFFLVVLIFGLALASVPFVYSITVIPPSRACGPFRDLGIIWDTVPRWVSSVPDTARRFLSFLGSLAFLIPLFALSSVILLFLVVQSRGYTHTINQLKKQLHQEGRDKQFLVNRIAAISQFGYKPLHPSL